MADDDERAILQTVSKPGRPLRVRLATIARCLVILTAIAVAAVFYIASDILTTLALALLLSLLLSPLVTSLERARLPRALASGVVVLLAVACTVIAVVALAQPVRDWAEKAPAAIQSVKQRLRTVQGSVEQVTKSAESLTSLEPPAKGRPTTEPAPATSLLRSVLAGTPHALGSLAAVILLLYFFLSSGDNFLRRLVEVAPGMTEKRTVVTIARDIQREMSRYLFTITLINAGLGAATAVACALLGVPNALLWGVLACFLNFAPYVGAAMTILVLGVVGLTEFESLGHAIAVPLTFLVLATIEGQLVTPTVIGRRLAVNPVVVFVWLLVWGALWGIIGLLLAGPLLACFRIVCQHTAALRPIYVLIGEAKIDAED